MEQTQPLPPLPPQQRRITHSPPHSRDAAVFDYSPSFLVPSSPTDNSKTCYFKAIVADERPSSFQRRRRPPTPPQEALAPALLRGNCVKEEEYNNSNNNNLFFHESQRPTSPYQQRMYPKNNHFLQNHPTLVPPSRPRPSRPCLVVPVIRTTTTTTRPGTPPVVVSVSPDNEIDDHEDKDNYRNYCHENATDDPSSWYREQDDDDVDNINDSCSDEDNVPSLRWSQQRLNPPPPPRPFHPLLQDQEPRKMSSMEDKFLSYPHRSHHRRHSIVDPAADSDGRLLSFHVEKTSTTTTKDDGDNSLEEYNDTFSCNSKQNGPVVPDFGSPARSLLRNRTVTFGFPFHHNNNDINIINNNNKNNDRINEEQDRLVQLIEEEDRDSLVLLSHQDDDGNNDDDDDDDDCYSQSSSCCVPMEIDASWSD